MMSVLMSIMSVLMSVMSVMMSPPCSPVGEEGSTLLELAVCQGREDFLELLLRAGARWDVDKDSPWPLRVFNT